jgi:hypothetical protein
VTLPGYLDSFAVVVDRKANTLVVSDDAEWAERLRDAVTRTLRDALSQRLGATRGSARGDVASPMRAVIEFLELDPSGGILPRRAMELMRIRAFRAKPPLVPLERHRQRWAP